MKSSSLFEKVKDNIRLNHLIDPGSKIIVGVSGGADSLALLDILFSLYNKQVFCAHLEHGVRGDESIRDMNAVKDFCRKKGIPCTVKQIDIPQYAERNNISIELAARECRYAFFSECLENEDADLIAVAHHKSDNAETFLLNLIRGAGPDGLRGMRWRDKALIRPFLNINKSEIIAYCKDNDIAFLEDSTNQSTDYTRNFIRHELLSRMEKQNPNIIDTIIRTSKLIDADNGYFVSLAEKALVDNVVFGKNELRIKKHVLTKNDPAISGRCIRLALKAWGVSKDIEYVHIQNILTLLDRGENGSRLYLPYSLRLLVSYDDVIFFYEEDAILTSYPLKEGEFHTPLGILTVSYKELVPRLPGCEYLDREALPEPLFLRPIQAGDYIVPLGMKGRKKMSDYLCDKKISQNTRTRLFVLASDREVFYVQGLGVSENAKISQNIKKVVEIKYIRGE